MKPILISLPHKKLLIVFLSIISLFLSKVCVYEAMQSSNISLAYDLKNILLIMIVSVVYIHLCNIIFKLTIKKFQVYFLLHIICMFLLSLCPTISFHYRSLPFSTTLFCVESCIYIAAILTPIYVENLHEYNLSNSSRYLYILSGFVIFLWESFLSASLKPALFHIIIFAFSWIYFMKKDKYIIFLGALISTIISALTLENRFTASDYLLDTAKRITHLGKLWNNKESQLSAHIHKFGITDHTALYLFLSEIFLIIFVCSIIYMVLNTRQKTTKRGITICLCAWIVLLILQTLYQFGILSLNFDCIFYGCGNYFLFLLFIILLNFKN